MGQVDVLPRVSAQSEANARSAFFLAGGLIGVTAWLVVVHHPRWAGAAAAGATVLLLYGSSVASNTTDRLLRFLDSVADRAFDGAILPSIALTMRHSDLAVAALALTAVGVSFVAAYIQARGRALGYTVRGSLLVRAGRYVAVAAGLGFDGLFGALVAVLVLGMWTAADEARQVAREGA